MYVDFFFFSSRRRHTRLQGDWSSDVCSSDLKRASDTPQYSAGHLLQEHPRMRSLPAAPHGRVRSARAQVRREEDRRLLDRKSTRLNSSHLVISYAVFCLKKTRTPSLPCPRTT